MNERDLQELSYANDLLIQEQEWREWQDAQDARQEQEKDDAI